MGDTRIISALFFSLALALGCGGGGSDGVPISEVPDVMAEVQCGHSFACCDSAELMAEYGGFNINSEAECVTVLSGFSRGFYLPRLEAGIASGRIVYHPDRMADCIAAIEGKSCAEVAQAMTTEITEGIVCADPFEGQVANGGACASDDECQSNFCDGETMDFEGNVTEGACGAAPGPDQPCSGDFECAAGSYCENGPSPTCRAAQADGSDCYSHDECSSDNCVDTDPMDNNPGACSSELRCDGM